VYLGIEADHPEPRQLTAADLNAMEVNEIKEITIGHTLCSLNFAYDAREVGSGGDDSTVNQMLHQVLLDIGMKKSDGEWPPLDVSAYVFARRFDDDRELVDLTVHDLATESILEGIQHGGPNCHCFVADIYAKQQ
jgi:hypothetical protein